MKVARAAGIVCTAAAIAVIVASIARVESLVYAAAIVCGVCGAVAALAARETVHHRDAESIEGAAPTVEVSVKKKEPTATVLLATLRNAEEGSERLVEDLQRVLAGIVADERGKVDRVEPHSIVALFTRGEHSAAAVHAARRMLSNVDALSRRLGHALAIAIAVHAGPRGEEAVNVAARVQEAATDLCPILVSAPAASTLGSALEKVDTVVADGWALDVFTFPPAQKKLPGF